MNKTKPTRDATGYFGVDDFRTAKQMTTSRIQLAVLVVALVSLLVTGGLMAFNII